MLSYGIAKELGMTIQQLWDNITPEEMLGWSAYFTIINEQMEDARKKMQRRR